MAGPRLLFPDPRVRSPTALRVRLCRCGEHVSRGSTQLFISAEVAGHAVSAEFCETCAKVYLDVLLEHGLVALPAKEE